MLVCVYALKNGLVYGAHASRQFICVLWLRDERVEEKEEKVIVEVFLAMRATDCRSKNGEVGVLVGRSTLVQTEISQQIKE